MNYSASPPSTAFSKTPFVLLWLVWAVLLPVNFVAEALFGLPRFAPWYFSSAVLAVAAWLTCLHARRLSIGRFAALVALGMTLGFLADVYGVSHRRWTGPDPLLVAIPLFALGHIAYIWGSFDAASRLGLSARNGWAWTVAIATGFWMVIAAVLWLLLVYPSEAHSVARWPCLPYCLLLATTTGVMTAISLLDRRFALMAVGAMLFLASDGFLAIGLFQNNAYHLGNACWITYGIGQMLIVFGAARVVNRAALSDAA
jgi:uncharacterized membrane protein YhhN